MSEKLHISDEYSKQDTINKNEFIKNKFVSVFHETKTNNIDSIMKDGLLTNNKEKNIGDKVKEINRLIDEYRTSQAIAHNLSREKNIFAYPYLEEGHTLGGAEVRFKPFNLERISDDFETLNKFSPEYLQIKNIKNKTDYVKFVADLKQNKEIYPGEILELQVDPNKCFVADLMLYNQIAMHPFDKTWMEKLSKRYWENIVSIADFKKYYKKIDIDYQKAEEAPDNYPETIKYPEILIPEQIKPKYIKVLNQEETMENYRKNGMV